MANKRQRKKQQQKKNIELLQKTNINKKEIKKLKNNTQHATAIYKKQQRAIKAAERSKIIQSLGLKVKDHSAKRYWSDERWNKWLSAENKKRVKKPRKSLKDENEYYLLIFWRDKTSVGFADDEVVNIFKNEYKYVTTDALVELINFYLRDDDAKGVEIGTAQAAIIHSSQVDAYIKWQTHISSKSNLYQDMHNWILVYKGKAKRYKELLLAIVTVIRLMYDHTERAEFINILLDNLLPQINRRMRERLANDIDWRGLS